VYNASGRAMGTDDSSAMSLEDDTTDDEEQQKRRNDGSTRTKKKKKTMVTSTSSSRSIVAQLRGGGARSELVTVNARAMSAVQRGAVDTARVILVRAQEILAEDVTISAKMRATTLNNLGTVCSKQNKHEESLGFALSAVAAARQITEGGGEGEGDEHVTTIEDKARCMALALHNLGVEQECLGDYEAAKRTFDASKDIVRKALDDSTGVDILTSMVSRMGSPSSSASFRSNSRPNSPSGRSSGSQHGGGGGGGGGLVLRPPSVERHPTYGGTGKQNVKDVKDPTFHNLSKLERRLHRQMLGKRIMSSEDVTTNKDLATHTSTTKSMDMHHLSMDL